MKLTLFVVLIDLKVSLPASVVRSLALARDFVGNFMNLKLVTHI